MNNPLITVTKLTHKVTKDIILDSITCTIYQGDYIAVIGQNGSGKSTFVTRLAGIENPQEGEIMYHKKNILGYVSQFSSLSQSAPITAKEYLSLSAKLDNNTQFNEYNRIFLLSVILDTQMLELSGGERQKVLLCGELLRNPDILILDEITSHIDTHTTEIINTLLSRLHSEKKMTIVRVTHNLELIQDQISRVLCITNACIHENVHTNKSIEHTHK